MPGADWVFVAVFALVGVVSVASLLRSTRSAADLRQGVMAAGMIAMIAPAADPLPRWAWVACFCATAAWAGARLVLLGPVYGETTDPVAWRRAAGRTTHQLAASLAMMLMLALGEHGHDDIEAAPAQHHGQATALVGGTSVLDTMAVFAGVAFLVLAAWTVARLPAALRGGRPIVPAACEAAMAAGMGAMLL